ncbi:hypothetical protein L0026_17445 [Pseudomonas aeruginosa]|uniref:hypothetical protein n=1 Tax=Pseudomonas aeruginosa TaxID=287 RepID=UPI001A34B8A3|nr:hypothetical protein [Pseudomonas aeruginosa]MBH9175622.1 hypothetical protein [Pseudomonas aeruginosa]UPG10296.1 hypothetical protein L0026_17445 [Pseudomonas aeruginosa]
MDGKTGVKVVGVGLFLVVVATIFMVAADGGTNSVAAAWVQAIGSVLAICYAFYIADTQHRQSELDREEEQENRLRKMVSIAHYAERIIVQVVEEHREYVYEEQIKNQVNMLRNARELFKFVDLDKLRNCEDLADFLDVFQLTKDLEDYIAPKAGKIYYKIDGEGLLRIVSKAETARKRMESRCKSLVSQ